MDKRIRVPKFSVASWPAWIQMIVACFVGAMGGGYAASKLAISRSDQSIRQQMQMRSIDRFISLGGEVLRDGDQITDVGMPKLKGLGFYTIQNSDDVRQSILYGGTLPDITQLYFSPFGVNRVGAGVADNNIMRFVHRNFPDLEYLDISNCRVTDAHVLQPMTNLKRLKIGNNPLSETGIESLKLLDSITEIWVGWPDRTLDSNSIYRNKQVKTKLIQALLEMDRLQKVHLYDNLQLTASEKTQMGKFELVKAYMN